MPIISVPWKEKPATMKIPNIAVKPPTKGASSTVQLTKPGDGSEPRPKIKRVPVNRKIKTVRTLMPAKMNSLSPYDRVDR